MKRYTQKALKQMVAEGLATDITNFESGDLPFFARRIGYSRGIYGLNGALYEDTDKHLFAITARCTNLFVMGY